MSDTPREPDTPLDRSGSTGPVSPSQCLADLTDRRPQIKDVLILDEKEYIIQAIDAKEDSVVLTRLGVASSSTFVLKGAQLKWQNMLRAWRPVNVRDFFERGEPTPD